MTIDEIKEAVKSEPTLLDGLVEFTIATEKGKEVLQNHAAIEFDKKIGTKVGELYSNIDNDIKEVLGDEKPSTMKTFDHVKKIATELKEYREKGGGDEALKAKVSELEAKLAEGKDKHWHDLYKQGTEAWTAKEQEYQQTLNELNGKIKETLVQTEIQKGITGVKLNSSIPKPAQEVIMSNAIAELSKNAKIVDGKVYLQKIGPTGELETWVDPSNFAPISSGKALQILLKDMIETKPDTGGGAEPDTSFGKLVTVGSGDKAIKTVNLDKSKVTSKEKFAEELDKALAELGIGRGTREWYEIEQATMKKMGVANLPTT